MFTQEEEALLTGDAERVEEFVDCDRWLILDWRGTEEEVPHDASQFLTEGSLSYGSLDSDSDSTSLQVRSQGREDKTSLPVQPQNSFRVLLRLATLLHPDFEICLFRCTTDSDIDGSSFGRPHGGASIDLLTPSSIKIKPGIGVEAPNGELIDYALDDHGKFVWLPDPDDPKVARGVFVCDDDGTREWWDSGCSGFDLVTSIH